MQCQGISNFIYRLSLTLTKAQIIKEIHKNEWSWGPKAVSDRSALHLTLTTVAWVGVKAKIPSMHVAMRLRPRLSVLRAQRSRGAVIMITCSVVVTVSGQSVKLLPCFNNWVWISVCVQVFCVCVCFQVLLIVVGVNAFHLLPSSSNILFPLSNQPPFIEGFWVRSNCCSNCYYII